MTKAMATFYEPCGMTNLDGNSVDRIMISAYQIEV